MFVRKTWGTSLRELNIQPGWVLNMRVVAKQDPALQGEGARYEARKHST